MRQILVSYQNKQSLHREKREASAKHRFTNEHNEIDSKQSKLSHQHPEGNMLLAFRVFQLTQI
jgi:hypothetical protein